MKSKTSGYDLAILIPAFAETKRLGNTLDSLAHYLKTHEMGRVAVTVVAARQVGDNSDTTVKLVSSKTKKFKTLELLDAGHHPGGLKGRDVQIGMKHIKGKYKMFMDADMATPLHHLESLVQLLKGGSDIVIGERDLAEIHKGFLRRFISMGGNLTVRILLGMKYKDTQCGFKGFRADVSDDLFKTQTIKGWGFDMEILAVARKRHYSVATIDINDWKDIAGGNLAGKAAQAALSSLTDILKIRWNLWMGRYNKSR